MPSRSVLERQLALAEESLKHRVTVLEKAGTTAEKFPTVPAWRKLNAECVSIRRRLRAVAAIEANNAEVERLKTAGDDEAAD